MKLKLFMRGCLTYVGAWCSARVMNLLDNTLNYLNVGHWAASAGFSTTPSFPTRSDIFKLLAKRVGDKRVLYLEFGVYRGESMREWSRLLTNPASNLHGFDTFEGLPEDWTPSTPKGYFTTHGAMPKIDDPRVRYFKGLFNKTLVDYTPPAHDVLILNLDADLYSSTIEVLRNLRAAILPGTYLYFDEFFCRNHELKAFCDFQAETGMTFRSVGQSRNWEHALFQRDK